MIQHLEADAAQILPMLPVRSVHAVVTSPPYWGLRSYLPAHHPAKHLEIGQEPTVAQYIDNLVGIFRHVARVLLDKGTIWLNLGDTYSTDTEKANAAGVKHGDLVGLPWRVALALQAEGWYVRSDIIWHNSINSRYPT
jgi:DNA modification methylase